MCYHYLHRKKPFFIFNFWKPSELNWYLEKLGLFFTNFQLSRLISFWESKCENSHDLLRFTLHSILPEQFMLESWMTAYFKAYVMHFTSVYSIYKLLLSQMAWSHHTPISLHFTLAFGEMYCTSSGSVCAPSCYKHTLMCWHVLCDRHQNNQDVIMVRASSTALHKSSLLQQQCTATCPLTVLHKMLSHIARPRLFVGQDNSKGDVG